LDDASSWKIPEFIALRENMISLLAETPELAAEITVQLFVVLQMHDFIFRYLE
jgi:hypothetical protein